MSFEKATSKSGSVIKRWAGVFVILAAMSAIPIMLVDSWVGWYLVWFGLGAFPDFVFAFSENRMWVRALVAAIRIGSLIAILYAMRIVT